LTGAQLPVHPGNPAVCTRPPTILAPASIGAAIIIGRVLANGAIPCPEASLSQVVHGKQFDPEPRILLNLRSRTRRPSRFTRRSPTTDAGGA